MYDLIIQFTGHTPINDIESLVYVILAGTTYVLTLVSVLYIITVISQIFSTR